MKASIEGGTGLPPDIADQISSLAHGLNPHAEERQGRGSALEMINRNRISDAEGALLAMKSAFSFRDWQSLALYHPHGYFPKEVDYANKMYLLPQMMSPIFGISIGEVAFAHYVNAAYPYQPAPTVLSLGAGRGYLDRDLIEHTTAPEFDLPDYSMYARVFRDDSRFIITDIGDRAIGYLNDQLQPLLASSKYASRVRVEKLDALNFTLPRSPFGIVYCNELIDSLPTEPVVEIDGKMHSVRIKPYLHSDRSKTGEAITQEKAREMFDARETGDLRFEPVFVPIEYDTGLQSRINKMFSAVRINHDDFNGVYPIFWDLDRIFKNIKASFDHGVFIVIDYHSSGRGMHNWNQAVNIYKSYKFGEEDISFQIDPQQVIEVGGKEGFSCDNGVDLQELLQQFAPLAIKDKGAIDRWVSLHQNYLKTDTDNQILGALSSYAFGINSAKHYSLMVFHF